MEMKGYAGKILRVDLSTGRIEKESLDADMAKSLVGGFNINAKLIYETVKADADPLSPENAIIAGAGPFVGTALVGTSKTGWAMRSPLTNTVAMASSGGFGAPLKWAGYDHLVITGRAEKPVYLTIFDDEVNICDATGLWGKDTYEASDALWDQYGEDCAVVCIGPAGENLVQISMAFVDKRSTLGRHGSGAVFGAKNLKAIVVRGAKGIKVADVKAFWEQMDGLHKRYLADPLLKDWMELGTTIALEGYAEIGNAFWKNWREAYPREKHVPRFGVEAFRRVREISLPCPACPLGCKILYRVKGGEFAGLESPQSCNTVAVMGLGTQLDLNGYGELVKCHDTANRYGLDNVETGYILSYILDLQEQGIIDKGVTDGLVLKRNMDTLLTWMGKIARREGFGDVIAGGYKRIFKELGGDAERYAIQVKGGSPDFDARGNFGVETFAAAVGLRGPHSQLDLGPTVISGRTPDAIRRYGERIGVPAEAVERVFVGPSGFSPGRFARYLETWNTTLDSVGICNRPPLARLYTLAAVTELYHITTGIKLEPQEILAANERGFNLYKMFNVREGFSRKYDKLPERWFTEPINIQGVEYRLSDYAKTASISEEDFKKLLDEYYDEWGWDVKMGIPTKEKLVGLGLKDAAEDLAKLTR